MDGPVTSRTMVVEDDRASRTALCGILARMGYEVSACETLAQALDVLEDVRPNIVLLDLMLPDGNGVEVLRRIRRDGLETRVAVVTATHAPLSRGDLAMLRPDKLFRKPLDINSLREWLAQ